MLVENLELSLRQSGRIRPHDEKTHHRELGDEEKNDHHQCKRDTENALEGSILNCT